MPSKPIQKNITDSLNKSWILQHSLPLKNCSNQKFWWNLSTPQATSDSKLFHSLSSWRNSNHDRATVYRSSYTHIYTYMHIYTYIDIYKYSSIHICIVLYKYILTADSSVPAFWASSVQCWSYIGHKAMYPPQVISHMWDHLSHARVLKLEKLVSMRIYISTPW